MSTRMGAGQLARVRVHFNLLTHLWSITAMSGPNRGRVVQHSDTFALTQCKFIVSEAGRQRVLAKRHRLVHAWVEGLVAPVSHPPKDAVEFSCMRMANPGRINPAPLTSGSV